MANFKETQENASMYRRCNKVTINNPLDNPSVAVFAEESVVQTSNGTYQIPLNESNGIRLVFDASQQIPLVDPDTLEPTGEYINHSDMYQYIMSAYIFAVEQKEQETATVPVP